MIPLLVFYIHIVAAAYVFTKRWQEAGTSESFVAVGFMTIVFLVGWSVTSFLIRFAMEPEGFGRIFDRDAASLVLLTALEAVVYSIYFKRRRLRSDNKKPRL
jgi:uncharacterized membrane protein YhdT